MATRHPELIPTLVRLWPRIRLMTQAAFRISSAMYRSQKEPSRLLNIEAYNRILKLPQRIADEEFARLLAKDEQTAREAALRMRQIRKDARYLSRESLRIGVDLAAELVEFPLILIETSSPSSRH